MPINKPEVDPNRSTKSTSLKVDPPKNQTQKSIIQEDQQV